MSAEQTRRAERIRETAELVGDLLADVVEVIATHADDIAAWTLHRRRDKCRPVTVVTTAKEKAP